MSKLHELGYGALMAVQAAMNADRQARAAKTFRLYSVDSESGLVVGDGGQQYLPQQAQTTALGTYYHGCTCMDVQTNICNLDRNLSHKAKLEGVSEASHVHATCQCKHHWMRRLACGLPLFVYTGSQRWMVKLGENGKLVWTKSQLAPATAHPPLFA